MSQSQQILTLATVVVDVGIVGIVLDCLLETIKCHRRFSAFHVDTGKLYPALCHRWYEGGGRLQICLCPVNLTTQEPKTGQ